MYYQIQVADKSYQKFEPLTYESNEQLKTGQVVLIPFRNKVIFGFISAKISQKPKFKLKAISSVTDIVLSSSTLKLHAWMSEYYPTQGGVLNGLFLPHKLSKQVQEESEIYNRSPNKLQTLTKEQAEASRQIKSPNSYLLHGETGSGKTRVYLEQIIHAQNKNKSSLILVPEIGLTNHIAKELNNYLRQPVLIVHSEQTEKTRSLLWQKIYYNSHHMPLVIVAPRSGLFLPINNLGLCVIDECHDQSYKNEQAPNFNATRVAAVLSKINNAICIMGSATPSVADFYTFEKKNLPIIKMRKLAKSLNPTKTITEIVDLKNRQNFSKHRFISDKLIDQIKLTLKADMQVLILLNRRGTARIVHCENCEWQAHCPRCETPLVYHADIHRIRCHTCGYSAVPMQLCPSCKHYEISFKSIGTKSVTVELQKLFPEALLKRFDGDNKSSDSLAQNLAEIKLGKVQILVGTQILAKGLDLPKLGLVGIIIADTPLFLPDYTANEKTFQLLYQVIGRVGRGHSAGHVIVQSYSPQNKTIINACRRDWQSFYDQEISERKQFKMPPFCFLLKLNFKRKTLAAVEKAADKLLILIKNTNPLLSVIGPTPAFIEKMGGKFNWQIIVSSTSRRNLVDLIKHLPSDTHADLDPTDLL